MTVAPGWKVTRQAQQSADLIYSDQSAGVFVNAGTANTPDIGQEATFLISHNIQSSGLTNVQQYPAPAQPLHGKNFHQLLEIDYTADIQTNQGTGEIYGGWVTMYNADDQHVQPLQSLRRQSGRVQNGVAKCGANDGVDGLATRFVATRARIRRSRCGCIEFGYRSANSRAGTGHSSPSAPRTTQRPQRRRGSLQGFDVSPGCAVERNVPRLAIGRHRGAHNCSEDVVEYRRFAPRLDLPVPGLACMV